MKMTNIWFIGCVVLLRGILCGGVFGRGLRQQQAREVVEKGAGKQVKMDNTWLYVCRLNNCTLVEYQTDDLGIAKKYSKYGLPYSYQRSSGPWGWRKLLNWIESDGGDGVDICEGDLSVLKFAPCCEEYVVQEDDVSVCRIAEQIGIDCDLFMMFNDLEQEFVNKNSVIQICGQIKAGDLIKSRDFQP